MRERVRETRRGSVRESDGEGLASRGVRASGFGISLDRCCRTSQIGNSRISLEASDGRFGSVCRLEANKGAASHFVFLDRSSVIWLEEVLQVASSIGWKFPASCSRTNSRRTVSVSSFNPDGEQVLKISESCANGSYFFVLVPSASDGWKRLLLLCQDWIASALAPPPPEPLPSSKTPASFASMVKGPSLSSVGRCSESETPGCPGISVEKDGIQDRLDYLECCVVFRICSQAVIDWSHFRRWANRNWGTALNAPIHKLDDDLWLLFVDSKAKVERIFSLNRNSFGGTTILLDKWIPEAGCSRVLVGENVEWITIRGIPIHLRSSDLFRQIGSVCGVFLGFEVCTSLSSVRIKIRRAGSIPEVVPICFEGVSFMLNVTTDRGNFHQKEASQALCSTGKAVLSPLPPSRFEDPSTIEFGSSSSSAPPSPVSSDLLSPASLFVDRTPPTASTETSSEGTPGTSSEVAIPTQRMENVVEVSDCADMGPRQCTQYVGLKLERGDNLWIVSTTTPLVRLLSGLNQHGFGLKVSMSPLPRYWAELAPDFSKFQLDLASSPTGYSPNDSSTITIGANLTTNECGFGFITSAPHYQSSCPRSSPTTSPPARSDVSLSSSEVDTSSESILLSLAVKEASALFGLELEGSRNLGMEAAINSCPDISPRSSRSRKDMEWHRLACSAAVFGCEALLPDFVFLLCFMLIDFC
ncbi:hypothetical protein LINPERHAP2_LOCUS26512 [Linum perenne]